MINVELTDKLLLDYLRDTSHFPYFRQKTKDAVVRLPQDSLAALATEEGSDELLGLWKHVLTDALCHLKRKDPREWKPGTIDFDTFFNEDSLGIPDLEKVVKAFRDFEPLMYGASPQRYRDHVAHSVRVWVIGQYLLREQLGRKLKAPSEFPELAIEEDEWECMWALAALCHDIGYPLSKVGDINKRANDTLQGQGFRSGGEMRFSFSAEMQPFFNSVVKLISSSIARPAHLASGEYLTHLQNKYYLKFLKSFDSLDHGVISALLMAKSLVFFLESDLCQDSRSPLDKLDARQFLIRREILRSVAAHTCADIYHLGFDALSFFLYFVDELQEAGRPTFSERCDLGSQPGPKTVITRFDSKSIETRISLSCTLAEGKPWIEKRLRDMQRRLRLAVGTAKMAPDLCLIFSLTTSDGERSELRLEHGAIQTTIPSAH